MTNLIKRKGLLFLIAIALTVAIMSAACKKKVTQSADFSVAGDTAVDEPIEEPTSPETPAISEQPLTPDGKLDIDKNRGLLQYDGKYFESKTYVNNDGTTFKYIIEIKNLNDSFNNTILIFTDGNQTKEYQQVGFTKGKGDQYNGYNSLCPYNHNSSVTLDVKFYNDENGKGWADVKPSNYNFVIKLALKNK